MGASTVIKLFIGRVIAKMLKLALPLGYLPPMFRSFFFVLLALCCQQLVHCSPFNNKISHPLHGEVNDTKIVNVNIEYHEHGDFVRIGEYFNGGKEYKGQRCIVRDNENVRTGLYFVVNFDRPLNKLPSDLTVNITLLEGHSLVPEKFEFKLPNKRKIFTAEVYCGITSRKIDVSKIKTWKIELIDGKGDIVTALKNYMWPANM
ncbi:MAG: hypothetical protein LBF94_00795 [Puniceicoccales bacterium]|jgi:hypothetical protein|nr:hypothetical protein [Puniceicoccales bacterium]